MTTNTSLSRDRSSPIKAGDWMIHTDGSIIEVIDEHYYRWLFNATGSDDGHKPLYDSRDQYVWDNWPKGYSLATESIVDRILKKYNETP